MIDWAKERADLEADYRKAFGKDIPKLDAKFTDEEMCDFLIECLRWRRSPNAREMDEHDLLEMQYRIKFPNAEGIPRFIVHMADTEWRKTMRTCLKTGKPYELPADIQKLIEKGVDF